MLADIFETFRNICFEKFDGISMESSLKKTKWKLDILTDTDMLLMVEGIRGAICHAIYQYAKWDADEFY